MTRASSIGVCNQSMRMTLPPACGGRELAELNAKVNELCIRGVSRNALYKSTFTYLLTYKVSEDQRQMAC